MAKKVYVGMSGGVDSSVTAALLKERGYDVTAVYMKNWSRDFPGFKCPWKEDYQDAKRVAVQLGIDLKTYDFEKQYRRKVVDYMVREYRLAERPIRTSYATRKLSSSCSWKRHWTMARI